MLNLLIADDEKRIREGLLCIPWHDIGVRIAAEAETGTDAVEVLQSEIIDIVLTDIRMPGIDGLELAKFISQHEINAEVILLSGHNDFQYAQKAISYDVLEYILKPSNPQELLAAVQRAGDRVEKKRKHDMRFQLLEAELGKKRLVQGKTGIHLGDFEHSDVSKTMLDYLAVHYRESISLADVSEQLHFSTIYLSKVIKRATCHTFLEILNALRVDAAAAKLRGTNCSVADICQSIAIQDPRYFSQVFKKYYGVTPSSYKKSPVLMLDMELALLVRTLKEG